MTVARVFPLVVKLLAVPFTASAQLRPAPDSTRRTRCGALATIRCRQGIIGCEARSFPVVEYTLQLSCKIQVSVPDFVHFWYRAASYRHRSANRRCFRVPLFVPAVEPLFTMDRPMVELDLGPGRELRGSFHINDEGWAVMIFTHNMFVRTA